MPRELIQASVDLTAKSLKAVSLSTPRPANQVMRVLSVNYDISINSGATNLPSNLYAGVSPKEIATSITEVSQGKLLYEFPNGVIFNQLVNTTYDDGTALNSLLQRSGVITPREKLYSMNPQVFIGFQAAEIGAGNPTVTVLFEVEFEFVNLTNTVATAIATGCI